MANEDTNKLLNWHFDKKNLQSHIIYHCHHFVALFFGEKEKKNEGEEVEGEICCWWLVWSGSSSADIF